MKFMETIAELYQHQFQILQLEQHARLQVFPTRINQKKKQKHTNKKKEFGN